MTYLISICASRERQLFPKKDRRQVSYLAAYDLSSRHSITERLCFNKPKSKRARHLARGTFVAHVCTYMYGILVICDLRTGNTCVRRKLASRRENSVSINSTCSLSYECAMTGHDVESQGRRYVALFHKVHYTYNFLFIYSTSLQNFAMPFAYRTNTHDELHVTLIESCYTTSISSDPIARINLFRRLTRK